MTSSRPLAVVVGGGAAGFFAAITLAEAAPQLRVLLLERSAHLLGKVRISGGGRCNVTHACFDPAQLVRFYPRGARELRAAFARWQPRDTVEWFAQRGVELKTEADGRMFPVTDSSQTIIDCLMHAARQAGVELHLNTALRSITRRAEGGFELVIGSAENGAVIQAESVLLACGGLRPEMVSLLKGLGHQVVPAAPSIFTFNIKDPRLEGLPGVAVPEARVEATGFKLHATGPLLITHWGLSGPAVLRLSAWGAREMLEAGYHFPIRINWLHGAGANGTQEAVRAALWREKARHPKRLVSSHPAVDVPQRLWESLLAHVEMGSETRWADAPAKPLNLLAEELVAGRYEVTGKGVFKEEFVTAGGVSRAEVDFRTMQSRVVPGLYFAGELLDVDGITGGFNFQAAWTTGRLAGLAMGSGLPVAI